MVIKTGDPVVLIDNTSLEEYDLKVGTKGWANSVTSVPGNGTYIFFMPEGDKEMYVLSASRLEVDEGAKAAGLELNEHTLQGRGDVLDA
jgi:hypothetical protein